MAIPRKQVHSRYMAYIALALTVVIVLVLGFAGVTDRGDGVTLGVLAGMVPALLAFAGYYMKMSTDENKAGLHNQ